MSYEEAEEAVFSELGASPQTPGIYRVGAQSRSITMKAKEKQSERGRLGRPLICFGTWIGAQVASQQSLILRPG